MKFSFEISRNSKAAATEQTVKKGKRLSGEVNRPQPDRVKMQMATLRQAVENARDINNPSWLDLYEIYRNTMTDAHVRSQYDVAVNKLQASPFVITRDDNDNDELSKLFMRPWFSQFVKHFFDYDMWGYTVVEFGQKDEDGEWEGCSVFSRKNIYPHNRNVLINETDTSGIPYGDNPWKFFLVEIGEPDDLGLLELVSREVIWKAFARRDWSELSEKWGKPHLVIKTDAEGEELNKRERAARNFANNAYFITDSEDEIDTLESKSGPTGYQIFEKNIRLIDEQISKLMNGQTGTSEEKAFVGSAEVHERILNDYHAARLRRLSNYVNYELIPFLIWHGYPLQAGDKIRFTELDPKQGEKNTNPEDPEYTPPEGGEEAAARVKSSASLPWS